jgi:hypothetical protein
VVLTFDTEYQAMTHPTTTGDSANTPAPGADRHAHATLTIDVDDHRIATLLEEREQFESLFASIESLLSPADDDSASVNPHAYRLAQLGRAMAERTGSVTSLVKLND